MIQINNIDRARANNFDMWQRISTAPFGRDLELAVFDGKEMQALIVPCRREPDGWFDTTTRQRIVIYPTHWRAWDERD